MTRLEASWSPTGRCSATFVAAAVLAGLFAIVPFAHGAVANQTIYVTFQATQTFSVTLPDGTPIGQPTPPGTTITPGTYELIFDDSTNVKTLDFQITGPNVSLQESMDGGEETSAGDYVTFLPSSQYSYHDANNQASQTFYLQTAASGGTVGATGTGVPGSNGTTVSGSTSNSSVLGSKGSSTSTSTSSSSATSALDIPRGTLTGTVKASGALSLTLKGKTVGSLQAGRYTLVVTDRSAKGGFTVQESRFNATTVTGVPFVGKRTITLTLRPGQWFYYPTFVAKKTYFVVTS